MKPLLGKMKSLSGACIGMGGRGQAVERETWRENCFLVSYDSTSNPSHKDLLQTRVAQLTFIIIGMC